MTLMMYTDETIAEALSPRIFTLILLPTEKCNFRCTYCYEDFAIGRMRPDVVSGVKNLITNRGPNLDRLTISWFGGEPLLAKNIVLDIGSYAHKLCQEHGTAFSAGFTTNAYLLTPDLLEDLVAIGHRDYQITLDGDEEWHNKTRVLANRKPTFNRIWSHLLGFRNIEGDFSICLRLHLHKDNVQSVKRLYAMLKKDILPDQRFSVYFHKVSNLSSDFSIQEGVLQREQYLEAIDSIIGSDPSPSAPSGAISEEHLSGYICYAAKPNSLMIRADGSIGKCTVALSDKRNSIGHLNQDGTLDIANEKLRLWMSGFTDLSTNTLGCPLATLQ